MSDKSVILQNMSVCVKGYKWRNELCSVLISTFVCPEMSGQLYEYTDKKTCEQSQWQLDMTIGVMRRDS